MDFARRCLQGTGSAKRRQLALVDSGMPIVTLASQLWQLFIVWSLMLGIATGLTAMLLGAVVASRWFVGRRGLVIGVLTASSATGQLAFLPLATWMIEHWAGVPLWCRCFLDRHSSRCCVSCPRSNWPAPNSGRRKPA